MGHEGWEAQNLNYNRSILWNVCQERNYTIFSDKISSIISCSLYIQDDILWWRDTAMEGANGGSGQHQIGREAEGGWTSYTR